MAEVKFTDTDLMKLIADMQKQTADLLAQQSRDSDERMMLAIQELKKPLPHEQAKIDKEIELERRKRVAKIKEAVAYGRTERESQFNCKHIKQAEGIMPQGHAFRAQVNSDNYFRPQCIRCFKNFPRIKCTDEQLKSGTHLQNVKTGLTAEVLLQWHIKTDPNCKDCKAGGCAVGDLRQMKQGFLDPPLEVAPDGKILASQLAG
jgi:hypothetical protein